MAGHVWVTVLGQDPSVSEAAGHRPLRARVAIPAEAFEPGPKGPRFHVVDYDATHDDLAPAHQLVWTSRRDDPDPLEGVPDEELIASRWFRAQNAYGVAARALDAFETALGRRIPWAFAGHQLHLVPNAFLEANAYYDPESSAVLLGYFPSDGRQVHLALSYDVVAHETTHAILDGLRQRFLEPGLPDQLAFHEAFADVVALLNAFSMPEVVNAALGPLVAGELVPADRTSEPALKEGILFGLGEEFGVAVGRTTALRRSVNLTPEQVRGWADDPAYREPHDRGEILVAAIAHTFLRMWRERLSALESEEGTLHRGRAAEEGAKSAAHLLTMLIRAIDWLPPLEFEFADYRTAVIAADEAVAPNDEHRYRDSLATTFESFEIKAGGGLVGRDRLPRLDYSSLNATEFRARRDEAYRFLWANGPALGVRRDLYTHVDTVLPSIRIGPDGLLVPEATIVYRQMLNGSVGELRTFSRRRLRIPPGLALDTRAQLHGGGVLIVDQFGQVKAHHAKPLLDWHRQSRRLAHLAETGQFDRNRRLGFSTGVPSSAQFAVLHEARPEASESW